MPATKQGTFMFDATQATRNRDDVPARDPMVSDAAVIDFANARLLAKASMTSAAALVYQVTARVLHRVTALAIALMIARLDHRQ